VVDLRAAAASLSKFSFNVSEKCQRITMGRNVAHILSVRGYFACLICGELNEL
jgi:hypothetical protein